MPAVEGGGRRKGRSGGKGTGSGGARHAADPDAALDALYAVPPPQFVARRGELAAEAKQAGDTAGARAVRGARRPTLAAWAANLLVRSRPRETRQFLDLGLALREAHRTFDPGRLRELSRQQWRVINALSAQAAQLAEDSGQRLSDTVRREVESTLRAVLADPGAADRWAAGRLESALTPPAGLSALADAAPATPRTRGVKKAGDTGPAKKDELAERRRVRQERQERAREKAEAAERTLRERREEQPAAEVALAGAHERREQARQEVDAAQRRADQARRFLAEADRDYRAAEDHRQATAEALARAERDARTTADEARRPR